MDPNGEPVEDDRRNAGSPIPIAEAMESHAFIDSESGAADPALQRHDDVAGRSSSGMVIVVNVAGEGSRAERTGSGQTYAEALSRDLQCTSPAARRSKLR